MEIIGYCIGFSIRGFFWGIGFITALKILY